MKTSAASSVDSPVRYLSPEEKRQAVEVLETAITALKNDVRRRKDEVFLEEQLKRIQEKETVSLKDVHSIQLLLKDIYDVAAIPAFVLSWQERIYYYRDRWDQLMDEIDGIRIKLDRMRKEDPYNPSLSWYYTQIERRLSMRDEIVHEIREAGPEHPQYNQFTEWVRANDARAALHGIAVS
jgi:hypothetical protein